MESETVAENLSPFPLVFQSPPLNSSNVPHQNQNKNNKEHHKSPVIVTAWKSTTAHPSGPFATTFVFSGNSQVPKIKKMRHNSHIRWHTNREADSTAANQKHVDAFSVELLLMSAAFLSKFYKSKKADKKIDNSNKPKVRLENIKIMANEDLAVWNCCMIILLRLISSIKLCAKLFACYFQ